ncbi:hypothetical protein CBR_g8958 [Chara braunii]|uniref:RING-type E3 ubiquitin transferase n=1 Tax=Chara braunii TaxID=69332 RepID=A0A388KNA2_CHABU|nr:hypothetical protein CBR_g8958 [Chara braunii]|eukprot:GBG71540.1 hypothetical protein CBR_g8958 [Chara braunii]
MLKFMDKELSKESDGVYPLIVRLETVPKNPPPDAPSRENAPPGEMLPKWVQAQTTYAVIEKRGDTWGARVLKQKLWVSGQVYELQEIYGIDNGGGGGEETGDTGKECVICLSEPRDTTVLPCRHMCMCVKCADQLRHQTNRCPICRCVVESLLEINVNDRQDASAPESQLNAQEDPAGSRGKDQSPQERALHGAATCSSSGLPQKQ